MSRVRVQKTECDCRVGRAQVASGRDRGAGDRRHPPHGTRFARRYDVPVRRAPLSGAAVATLLSLSVPAAANGRFPASNQLAFSSSDKNLIVLRTSYGLLPSHDNGATWGYICENALGLGPADTEDPVDRLHREQLAPRRGVAGPERLHRCRMQLELHQGQRPRGSVNRGPGRPPRQRGQRGRARATRMSRTKRGRT